MKVISIIIATYNASKTIKKCLDSIVPQLTDECELVVVDGGSRDSTNDIIDSYGENVAVHISEPDKGIYDAWNKGVKISHGDWIAFVGADDILLPNALNNYLEVIRSTDGINTYDYICANNEYVTENGVVSKIIGSAPKWRIYRKRMNAAHVASLHNRKNLFDTVGYYDLNYKICADYELLLRKKDKLKYIFLPKRIARMQMGGVSFSTRAIMETYRMRKQHHTVSIGLNIFLLIRDWACFKFYCVRQLLKGKIGLRSFIQYMVK